MPNELPGGLALDPCEVREPDEGQLIDEILAIMRGMQRESWGAGPQLRGAHAKAHGVLWGRFEVVKVPPALRHGLFATPASYDVCIRASSFPQAPTADHLPNIRGIALKVLGTPGRKILPTSDAQDFLLITADQVSFGTVATFREFILSQASARGMSWFTGPEAKKRVQIQARTTRPHANILGQDFSSTTPYRLGDQVVKYVVRAAQVAMKRFPSGDHLKAVTVDQLAAGGFVLEFSVQVQNDPVAQPIEDASVGWSTEEAPPILVARIHLPAQEVNASGRDAYGEGLQFDPWHCLPEHRPLGGLNRARGVIYQALAADRLRSLDTTPYEAEASRSALSETALPEHERAPEARAKVLADLRAQYVQDFTKLPPLVMCAGVPTPSTASMQWIAVAGGIACDILANVLGNKAAHAEVPPFEALLPGSPRRLLTDLAERLKGRLADAPPPQNHLAARIAGDTTLRKEVDEKLRYILSGAIGPGLGLFSPLNLFPAPRPLPRASKLEEFEALHRAIPRCPAASGLDDDTAFARRRLVGPNPTFLERIDRLPDHFPVCDDHMAGDSLTAALAEGRAFLADYGPLEHMLEPAYSKRGVAMYAYAPLALFVALRNGGGLRPVAIQCGQDPSQFPVVVPADGWDWRVARTVVEIADMCWYEPVTHLGLTHLMMEPIALATHRALAPNHPLSRLILPHCEGTISVNDTAVHHLLADGGAIDQTFAATISSIRTVAANAVLQHDFRGDTPGRRLAARGLDDASVLPDNAYRDDSARVWGAIERWVSAYVRRAYPSEQAVTADPELRSWVSALSRPPGAGGLNGFGLVVSRADLSDVLCKIVYTASAGHASVNFPQWTDSGFAPRMAGAAYAPVPPTGATEAQWYAMLPTLEKAELHAEFLYLLGTLYYSRLGQYRSPDWPNEIGFRDPVVLEDLLPAFQRDLDGVEAAIDADNRDSRKVPYEHLRPSRIPQSINV